MGKGNFHFLFRGQRAKVQLPVKERLVDSVSPKKTHSL